jgi:hypothetical protein
MTRRRVMESLNGLLEVFMREILKKILDMDLELCVGLTELLMKENGLKEYNVGKGNYN